MRHFLLILAVVALVGCGESKEEQSPESKPASGTLTARAVDGPSSSSRQWPDLPDEFIPLDKFIVNYGPLILRGDAKVNILELNAATSDVELKHLTGLVDLIYLTLGHSQITDAGLEHLKSLTKLRELTLNDTQITDVGLEHLKGLPELEGLNLNGIQATDAGVAELQKALPNCIIEHNVKK